MDRKVTDRGVHNRRLIGLAVRTRRPETSGKNTVVIVRLVRTKGRLGGVLMYPPKTVTARAVAPRNVAPVASIWVP